MRKDSVLMRNSSMSSIDDSNSFVPFELSDTDSETSNGNCFVKINNEIYDLTSLSDECRTYYTSGKTPNDNYDFNFCSNVHTNCNTSEGLFVNKDKCQTYGGNSTLDKEFTTVSSNQLSKRKWGNKTSFSSHKKLRMKLPPGEVCKSNQNQRYQIIYELECDPTESIIQVSNNGEFDANKCINVIKMRSKYGCPSDYYSPWWNQFGVTKQTIAIILIIFGLYFLIFGEKCQTLNAIIIIGSSFGVMIYSFANTFYKTNLMASLGIGALTGALFVVCLYSAIKTLMTVMIGYILGNLFYNFEVKFFTNVDPNNLYWITIAVFMITAYIFVKFIEMISFTLATSIIGSYAFVRGISLLLNGFPDEQYVMKLIQKKKSTIN